MQPEYGIVTFFEDGAITVQSAGDAVNAHDAGDVIYKTDASNIKEALVKAGVGCGLIYLKLNDGITPSEHILCRFSMSGLKNAGELCKIINYFVKTGTAIIPDTQEESICKKCGRAFIEEMNVCLFCYSKTNLFKTAYQYLKPYAKTLVTAQFFLTISSILFLMTVLFNRHLIDNFFEPRTGTLPQVATVAFAMLGARIVGEIIFIIFSRRFNKATISYANDLRVNAYDKVQTLSMNSLSKRTSGDLIRRIMQDTANIREFLTDAGRWSVEHMIMFAVALVIMMFVNIRLTLLVLVPVPIIAFALSRFWRIIIVRFERQWRKESRCQSILHDIIKGIRTVKSFGNEEHELKKFSRVNKELAQISSENEVLWATMFPLMMFFSGLGEFLVLYFGGRAIIGETFTIGALVLFTMCMTFIYAPLRWLVSFPRWLASAMTSLVKVFEVLGEESEITESENPNNVPISGGVRFDGVSFGYKSYEPVLKDIDIDIKPGEMIGLVGRSGVGKSTLINLVLRLYDPNIGAVKINDTDIRDISPKYLHENIGVVFQDSFLFAGTVFDNIVYAKPDATLEEVIAACKAANAHDFIMQTADGYNTLIGEGGHSISGGERQRISIARAIIKNPEILILDEATSSLDVETESLIQESLQKLIKGRTTIAIAHRLSTLRNANRLIVLDEGSVAEVGTHTELLKKKRLYYNLVMAQRQTNKTAK